MTLSDYSCKICMDVVKDNNSSNLCNICENRIYTICVKTEQTLYENLKEVPFHCDVYPASMSFPSLQVNVKDYVKSMDCFSFKKMKVNGLRDLPILHINISKNVTHFG